MPSRTIANQNGMGARGYLCADFLQMLVHRFGVHRRHDDGGTNATLGADCAEQRWLSFCKQRFTFDKWSRCWI
jgi:hypothetical protein